MKKIDAEQNTEDRSSAGQAEFAREEETLAADGAASPVCGEEGASDLALSAEERKKVSDKIRLKRNAKEYLFVLSLIAWPIIQFLVFWVYVNFESFTLIFKVYKPLQGEYVWSGVDDIVKLFKEMVLGESPVMNRAMWNSVFSIIPGLFLILPLAFITAYAFYKHVPGERLFRVVFYLPSMISIVVLTMCYKYLFDPNFGSIRLLFENVFGIEGLKWLTPSTDNGLVWPLIYLYCLWSGLGSNVILMSGAMQRIPKEIAESAKLEGVGFWREAWSITLPLTMTTVSNFIVLSVMGMFSFMMQPMLLTNETGGPEGMTQTIAMYVYATTASGLESSMKSAVTIGILFSLLFGPWVFVIKALLDKFTPKIEF